MSFSRYLSKLGTLLNSSGQVQTAAVADANITAVKIADANVTTPKIADANVTLAKLSATGTKDATTYLRGDNTWAAVSGGVTSFVGQTGAVDPTALGAIGSVIFAANTSTSSLLPGTTVAGSSLRYMSTITQLLTSGPFNTYYSGVFSEGSSTTQPSTSWSYSSLPQALRTTTANVGYAVPGGTTALAGTWRAMQFCPARNYYYANLGCCGAQGAALSPCAVFVRIA